MKKLNRQGFTLIELVVVMAIIAVLAVLVVGAITIARNTAKETTHRANAKAVQAGLEARYSRTKNYTGISSGNLSAIASDTSVSAVLQMSNVCNNASYNGGGAVTFSTASGSPAYTINVANAACDNTNSGDKIDGPVN
ncbi:MAG: type II secretion system protein [bacterium]|nr:type II secretion system protein [bacterium]